MKKIIALLFLVLLFTTNNQTVIAQTHNREAVLERIALILELVATLQMQLEAMQAAGVEGTPLSELTDEPILAIDLIENSRIDGKNASIKQSIGNMRNQAEVAYNENFFTFEGVCESSRIIPLLEYVQETLTGNKYGVTFDIEPSTDGVACLDGDQWYVIQTPLIPGSSTRDESNYWCIDSTGFAGGVNGPLSLIDTRCVE